MADALRGGMDAQYKHVVLGPILLKYISDTFEERHANAPSDKMAGEVSVSPGEGNTRAVQPAAGQGGPDSSYGRQQALNTIQTLETQADTMVKGAAAFGLTIDASV